MKGLITIIFFVVALQSSCYLCTAFEVFGPNITYPLGSGNNLNDLTGYFDIERLGFTSLMGLGGGAIAATLLGIVTRNGTYALYTMLIFGFGSFIPLAQNFVLALPNTLTGIFESVGVGASITSPLLLTFGVWLGMWVALSIFGLIFNREMT